MVRGKKRVAGACGVCSGQGYLPRKRKEVAAAARPGVVKEGRTFSSGWVPSGPVPPGAGGDPDLEPRAGEELCFLAGHWRIFQRVGGHRYSTDDVVTAWFAARAMRMAGIPVTRTLDIGCGIGSVLMMTAWKHPAATCVGVEAQSLSWAMACRSIRYNGASARVEARHGDLRDASVVPEGASFDLVTGTPPYFKITQTKTKKTQAQKGGAGRGGGECGAGGAGGEGGNDEDDEYGGGDGDDDGEGPKAKKAKTGTVGASESVVGASGLPTEPPTVALTPTGGMPSCEQSAPARFEFRGGIEEYCSAAGRCIAAHGRFVVVVGCATADDRRVCQAAVDAGLRVTHKLRVHGKVGRAALIAVYVMAKGGSEEAGEAEEAGKAGTKGGGGGVDSSVGGVGGVDDAETGQTDDLEGKEGTGPEGGGGGKQKQGDGRVEVEGRTGEEADALETPVVAQLRGFAPFEEFIVAVRGMDGERTAPYKQLLEETGLPA